MAVKEKVQKLEKKADANSGFIQRWFVRLSVLALIVSFCAYLDSIRVAFFTQF